MRRNWILVCRWTSLSLYLHSTATNVIHAFRQQWIVLVIMFLFSEVRRRTCGSEAMFYTWGGFSTTYSGSLLNIALRTWLVHPFGQNWRPPWRKPPPPLENMVVSMKTRRNVDVRTARICFHRVWSHRVYLMRFRELEGGPTLQFSCLPILDIEWGMDGL
jgi:hypothetical protein